MKNNQPFITINELRDEFVVSISLADLIDKKGIINAKYFIANFWLKKMSEQKERLIKEVRDLDVSTMTYGAFRRKVLRRLQSL